MSKRSRHERKLAKLASGEHKGSSIPLAGGNMVERMVATLEHIQRLEANNEGYSPYGYRTTAGGTEYDAAHNTELLRKEAGLASKFSQSSYKGSMYSGGNGSGNSSSGPQIGYRQPPKGSENNYQFHVTPDKKSDTFTCESTEVTGKCPIATVPDIVVERTLWDSWIKLADELTTEWIAYFVAVQDKEGDWNIESFYFPPQTATGSSVDVPSAHKPRAGTNGAIHSHVQMAAFWSATDKAHSNWPIEIVINAKGNYEALVRHKLKCGEYAKSDAKVMLSGHKVDKGLLSAVKLAFTNGARLAKGKVAKEDDSPIPADKEDHTLPSSSITQLPMLTDGQLSQTIPQVTTTGDSATGKKDTGAGESLIDSAAEANAELAEADYADCATCDGLGIVEKVFNGQVHPYETEFCNVCHGWGKLLDGKPIAAGQPDSVDYNC